MASVLRCSHLNRALVSFDRFDIRDLNGNVRKVG